MRLFRQICVAIRILDVVTRGMQRFASDVGRIGTHVGDETHAVTAEINAFIELLRDAHRAVG